MTQNNPLTFDDSDKLNLKAFAENLFNNIEKGIASSIGEQGAYTISLNAEFGNGKTTFLKMFERFIINSEKRNDIDSIKKSRKTQIGSVYNTLFIDAWKSDFYKEPIIAVLSELANYMQKNNGDNKKIIETIGKIFGNIGNQLIQNKIGINLKETVDSVKAGKSALEAFNQRKEIIEDIKKAVSEYIKKKIAYYC